MIDFCSFEECPWTISLMSFRKSGKIKKKEDVVQNLHRGQCGVRGGHSVYLIAIARLSNKKVYDIQTPPSVILDGFEDREQSKNIPRVFEPRPNRYSCPQQP